MAPMLATASPKPPKGDGWSYEIKWDGVRAVVGVLPHGSVRAHSRNARDITGSYPELPHLSGLVTEPVLLDGELVTLDPQGRPSFYLLQHRMHVQAPSAGLLRELPVLFYVFDIGVRAQGQGELVNPSGTDVNGAEKVSLGVDLFGECFHEGCVVATNVFGHGVAAASARRVRAQSRLFTEHTHLHLYGSPAGRRFRETVHIVLLAATVRLLVGISPKPIQTNWLHDCLLPTRNKRLISYTRTRANPRISHAVVSQESSMAQKVLVQLVDDLDGTSSADVTTIQFGLDGVSYEVDLTEKNANRLRNIVADYIESARRTGGRLKRGTRPVLGNGSAPTGEAGQIREWAQQNGVELAARGRIPAHVVEAYKEAQNDVRPKARMSAAQGRRPKRRSSVRARM